LLAVAGGAPSFRFSEMLFMKILASFAFALGLAFVPLKGSAGVQEGGGAPSVEAGTARIYLRPAQAGALKGAAEELARRLKECSGLDFATVTNEAFAGKGIGLLVADGAAAEGALKELKGLGPEGLAVAGTPEGVTIAGNSALAVNEAVFFYLEKLGYRFYFPHKAWHIAPQTRKLFGEFSIVASPDYAGRRISQNAGTMSKAADADFAYWERANRMGGSLQLACGHAWDGIISRNKAEFEKHPEYLAKLPPGMEEAKKAKRGNNNKFCCTNEGLIRLCIRDALQRIENPKPRARGGDEDGDGDDDGDGAGGRVQMVSMEPSDGSGFCTCASCARLGGASEQIFWLANEVAKGIREKHPGVLVGLYAYNEHAAPPSFELSPNLFVAVCMAFNQSRYSYDQLLEMWGKKLPRIGVREFYGVLAWDNDMPGRMRAGRPDYLARTIPRFHKAGAVSLQAQSSVGWMSRGLGQYLASRLFWETRAPADAIADEFFGKCFGKARKPVEQLFALWQANPNKLPLGHDLAAWLRLVREADALADNEGTRERLAHLKAYLHFVSLYQRFASCDPEPKEEWLKRYTELLSWCWRTRDLQALASWPIVRQQARGRAPAPEYGVRHPQCVWKKDGSLPSAEEIERLARADAALYRELAWLKPTGYANAFKPLAGKGSPAAEEIHFRMAQEMVVEVPKQGTASFRIAFGQVRPSEKKARIRLYGLDQDVDEEVDVPAFEKEVPIDEKEQAVSLAGVAPGTWRMVVEDHRAGWVFRPDKELRFSAFAGPDSRMRTLHSNNSFVIYVPPGTSRFAVIHHSPFALRSPSGRTLAFEMSRDGMSEVEVKPNEAGAWQVSRQSGQISFLGVPPWLSASARQMLLPENVP
jgi:hypothetical protein